MSRATACVSDMFFTHGYLTRSIVSSTWSRGKAREWFCLFFYCCCIQGCLSCLADFTSAVSVPEVLHFVHLINSRWKINCRCRHNGDRLLCICSEKAREFWKGFSRTMCANFSVLIWYATRNQPVVDQRQWRIQDFLPRGVNIQFCQLLPKTEWNWKNLDGRGGGGGGGGRVSPMKGGARNKICHTFSWPVAVAVPGFPRGGERQHTILPNFPENCMKSKEFQHPGGRVPPAP